MNSIKKIISVSCAAIVTSALAGCGSSGSSNDQGTSFTLYNFYADAACGTQLNAIVAPLGQDVENGSSTGGNGAGPIGYAGIQNNLLSQTLRVRRAFYKFYVEGATAQPPATSAPSGIVLGAAGSVPGGSLPGAIGGNDAGIDGDTASPSQALNTGCLGIQMVPTDILSYVSLNRSQFPELPFTMRVEVTLRGVTSSANELDSNPLDFLVQFTEDNVITPTEGSGLNDGSSSSSAAATVEEGTSSSEEDTTTTEDSTVL